MKEVRVTYRYSGCRWAAEREPPSSRDERARRPRVRRANSAITVNLLPTANLEKDSEKAETKTSKLVR